jgi:type IV pilus assembly protein PilY1
MRSIILFCMCLISTKAIAEDIELYVKHNIDKDENPRVLFIFDTSGSMAWSTANGRSCGYNYNTGRFKLCPDSRLGVAKDAITKLVTDNSDIDFGLMRFKGGKGGYVLAKIGSSQSKVLNKISGLQAGGATPLSETLWEAYLYLTGGKRFYSKNVGGRDTSIENGNSYFSPFRQVSGAPERCDNSVNVILMTDGDPSNDSQQNNNIKNLHQQRFGSTAPIFNGNYMPALAKSIHGDSNTDVDLYPATSKKEDTGRVYTIGFGTGMSSSGKNILEKTAQLGGGQYLHANNASQLSQALASVTNSLRQESDSFALPVAANTGNQTKSSQDLYYTMFLPETHTRWKGNIKKLKVSNDGTIVDMSGNNAIDSDGKIDENATTFWSESGSKDGNKVDKGGVNYQLSRQKTRKIYSDFGSTNLHNLDYNTALSRYGGNKNKLAQKMGAPANETASIMNWARGIDVDDEDLDGNRSERRETIFGDPLHSKIVSINYGTETSPNIRLLVGTNAGFMHMFKDNGNSMTESWAFIPESLLPLLKSQKDAKADTKLYGVDGQSTIYHDDKDGDNLVSTGDNVWLFFGLRRGGKEYYALNITDPDSPKLMWGGPIKGGSGDFKMLGQTWAKPLVTHIEKEGDDPVVIFPAGYDTNKDNVSKTDDTIGKGVYIIKAKTGELVWSLTGDNGFTGKHSIAANVTTLDSNYDGYDDRIYMADTGGGVWRIDMPGTNPNKKGKKWTHFKLAQLAGNSASDDRRFYNAPIVARTYFNKVSVSGIGANATKTRKKTPYDAVLLGSGNRTRPISSSSVVDYLFMIRDEHTVTKSFEKNDIPAPIEFNNLLDVSNDPFAQKFTDFDAFTDLEVELGDFEGWKYRLSSKEKSLAQASVAGGVAYFTSFSPPGSSTKCEVEAGSGKLYAFHLHYGTKVFRKLSFDTKAALVEAPEPYFACKNAGSTNTNSCETIIKLIVPPVKTDSNSLAGEEDSVWNAPEIANQPELDDDGHLKRPDTNSAVTFGLETKQLYIYKREENDEK